ncbi:MAG TPA: peptidoglycan-binding domain-containing protein [Candidatus Binatia bacterium]
MKFCKSILAGVSVVGLLGSAPVVSLAQDMQQGYDSRKSIEDDSSLAPNVPGVTSDENTSNMSQEDKVEMEQALADSGYDPGPVDGVIDDQTRDALREFQEDHSLVATGIVDPATGELLGVVISEPS